MATIRDTMVLDDQYTPALNNYVQGLLRAQNAARQAQNTTRQFAESASTASHSTSELVSSLRNMAGAYLGVQGISSLFNLSDTMTQTTARLDMMNDGLQTTAELNQMIYESAQRSRGSYQATADMVSKLGNLAGDAFSSNKELVDFAEQLNKQIRLSGASTQAADAAMLQLTQAMSSGVLRGEELNSILEQTPTIAKTIAEYMGVTTGQMREMASEGQVTATVVKNALLGAAEEVNAKFQQIPLTWAQVWTMAQNTAIMALQPVLDAINWAANNLDKVVPVLAGLAAGMLTFYAATSIANGALKAMFATLVSNPVVLALAVGIGAIVYITAKWVQSVGGLRVAWLMFKNVALTAAEEIYLGMRTAAVGIFDAFGSLVSNAAQLAQSFANMWIDAANMVIRAINLIPGNNIPLINEATFGTRAMESYQQAYQERHDSLASMRAAYDMRQTMRASEIAKAQAEAAAGSSSSLGAYSNIPTFDQVSGIADSMSGIKKSMEMTDEDLKSLVDIAERRYVNNINLTSQAPVINITGQNTGNTPADRQNLANALRDILVQQVAAGSVQTTARAF